MGYFFKKRLIGVDSYFKFLNPKSDKHALSRKRNKYFANIAYNFYMETKIAIFLKFCPDRDKKGRGIFLFYRYLIPNGIKMGGWDSCFTDI